MDDPCENRYQSEYVDTLTYLPISMCKSICPTLILIRHFGEQIFVFWQSHVRIGLNNNIQFPLQAFVQSFSHTKLLAMAFHQPTHTMLKAREALYICSLYNTITIAYIISPSPFSNNWRVSSTF